MSWPHIHVVLNHIPIVGTGFCVLLLLAAWKMRDRDVTGLAFAFIVLVALSAVPVFFSGEPAGKVVESMAHIPPGAIHAHEEAAEPAFIAVLIAGGLAAFGLFCVGKAGGPPKWVLPLTLIVLLATAGLMLRAANRGGKIQHQELRPEFQKIESR